MDNSESYLLYSILSTEESTRDQVKHIIAYIDYMAHAIITYNEFYNGIIQLKKKKLIIEDKDGNFIVNKNFKEWFCNKYKNKKRAYLWKIIESVKKYINEIKEIDEEDKIEIKLTEEYFEKGLKEYKDK
jgi:hypothetical protein